MTWRKALSRMIKNEGNRKKIYKWIGIFFLFVGMVLANKFLFHLTPEKLNDWIQQSPIPAPLLYILVFGIRSLLLLPITIFLITGGLLFPWYIAILYTLIGVTFSAMVSLAVIRGFGKGFQLDKQKNVSALMEEVKGDGFRTILFLRLLPGINYDFMTYICAKTGVSWWKYAAASLIGAIPSTVLYISIGYSLFSFDLKSVLIIGVSFIFLLLVGWNINKKLSHKVDLSKIKREVKKLMNFK
ncbi:TVP38/TMEM64 family protein [Bacillus tianshenii]|nr:TVP38/TMEM64 family protein [Bacillus tianshenii]